MEAFLTRSLAPFEIVSAEGLELIEHNADTILERVGVEIRDYPSAIERFRDAGADVDGTRVRFPRGMCRQIVQASAPATYTQHGRNPSRNVEIGGKSTVFVPNYGSPFVHDHAVPSPSQVVQLWVSNELLFPPPRPGPA